MKRIVAIAVACLLLFTMSVAFAAGGKEPHPRIRAAIRAIDVAIAEMKAANHDFGGHRVEAIEACENAQKQLKAALAYDKK
ncbi:MAG TPA: hypothetical protein VHR45_06865 [Thermoanaerobaculia bacterium]|nr:hypothetical protein [Thermoanaerobaculia bacterium]